MRAIAAATLLAGAAACTPAGPTAGGRAAPPAAAPGLPAAEPEVRIGVRVDTTSVDVASPGGFRMLAAGRRLAEAEADEVWTFRADDDGRIVGRAGSRRVGPVAGPVTIETSESGTVTIGGSPYRGSALLRAPAAGRITAVNVLALEDYLLGVVPAEIPSLHIEAVKAQAVAARTYAIGNLGRRDRVGFDFFATVADQVYGGLAREDTMAARAVRETRGEIITYDGVPIVAYYHSTCGGRTASIDQVWRSPPQPYLASVSDAKPGGGHYCDISNRFDWTEEWSGDELAQVLIRYMSEYLGRGAAAFEPIESLEIERRTTSGRVGILRIRAGGEDWRIRGDSIRWFLRPADGSGRILNSVLFDLDQERDDGRVSYLRVDGHGWGHGIGMCQMGAIGRARAGQDYRAILAAYYTGTEISRLY